MSNFSLVILSITIFYVFDVSESTDNAIDNIQFENRDFKPEAFNEAVKLSKVYPYVYRRKDEDIVSVCPGEQNFSQDRCFYTENEPSESDLVICKEKFKPSLVNLNKSCGDGGTWYSFQYKICNRSKKSNIDNVAQVKEEKSSSDEFDFNANDEDSEEHPEIMEKQQTDLISIIESKKSHVVEVYAFCYNGNTKQTLFTRHTMSRYLPYDIYQVNEEISEILSTETLEKGDYQDFNDDLTFMSNIYNEMETENQKIRFKQLFDTQSTSESELYLVPQMLTPKLDLSTTLSRGVYKHVVNIRPIWKSRFQKWNLIRRLILLRKSNDYRDFIFTIYNGTYGSMKVNGERIYLDDNNKVTIPRVWWMVLLEERSRTGIIIAMNNDIGSSEKKLCEEDICKANGWDSVNSENLDGYCCEVTKTRLKGLGLSFLEVPVGSLNLNTILKERKKKNDDD